MRRRLLEGASLVEASSRGDPTLVVSEAGGDADRAAEATPILVADKTTIAGEGGTEFGGCRDCFERPIIISAKPRPSSTNEKGKCVVVDDYESYYGINPEDMMMFEEGFTRVEVRAEGPSRMLEIP